MLTEIEEVTARANKRRLQNRDPLHMPSELLVVTYNSKELYVMNKRLLDQQNCWGNLEAIKEAHWFKNMLYDMIESTTDPDLLKELAKDITEVEFELQRLWKFTEDAKFHRWWETPKCTCPKLDNNDAYPTGYYVTNLACPLHGYDATTRITSDDVDDTLPPPVIFDEPSSDSDGSDDSDGSFFDGFGGDDFGFDFF